jgi:hypothetical protein
MVSPWRRSSGTETCRRDHIIKQKRDLILCTPSPVFPLLTVKMHGLTWMFMYTLGPLARLREVTTPCLSGQLSVRRYQLGSHLTDFREIWYWGLLLKSIEKMYFLIEIISGTLHKHVTTQDNILLNSSYMKKSFTRMRKYQETFHVQQICKTSCCL